MKRVINIRFNVMIWISKKTALEQVFVLNVMVRNLDIVIERYTTDKS